MLDVCHEEIGYMTNALSRRRLRECALHTFIQTRDYRKHGSDQEQRQHFLRC